jgi:hypothetical protein
MSKIAKFGCELLQILYTICITRGKNNHFWAESGSVFIARNTNIYKICELHRAIFSSFYNISQLNSDAVLLILR